MKDEREDSRDASYYYRNLPGLSSPPVLIELSHPSVRLLKKPSTLLTSWMYFSVNRLLLLFPHNFVWINQRTRVSVFFLKRFSDISRKNQFLCFQIREDDYEEKLIPVKFLGCVRFFVDPVTDLKRKHQICGNATVVKLMCSKNKPHIFVLLADLSSVRDVTTPRWKKPLFSVSYISQANQSKSRIEELLSQKRVILSEMSCLLTLRFCRGYRKYSQARNAAESQNGVVAE